MILNLFHVNLILFPYLLRELPPCFVPSIKRSEGTEGKKMKIVVMSTKKIIILSRASFHVIPFSLLDISIALGFVCGSFKDGWSTGLRKDLS